MPAALKAKAGMPGWIRETPEDLTPEERLDHVEADIDWHKGSMTDMRDRLEKLEREYSRLVNFANALAEQVSKLKR
jgi:predicted nuclease with TOPRIM domain